MCGSSVVGAPKPPIPEMDASDAPTTVGAVGTRVRMCAGVVHNADARADHWWSACGIMLVMRKRGFGGPRRGVCSIENRYFEPTNAGTML